MALTDAPFMGRVWSAVPAGTYTSAPPDLDVLVPTDCTGAIVTLNVTAIAGGNVGVTLQGIDETSQVAWQIAAITPVTGTGSVTLQIHPAIPTSALSGGLQSKQGQITPRVRLHVSQTATSATYSVGVDFTL